MPEKFVDRPVQAVNAEKLAAAYHDLVLIDINEIEIPELDPNLQQEALAEVRTGFLNVNKFMITSNLQGILRRVTNRCLAEQPSGLAWSAAMRAFREALRPYERDLGAIENLQTRIDDIEADRLARLSEVNAQARANHAYFSAEQHKNQYEQNYQDRVASLGGRTINTFVLNPMYYTILVMIGLVEFKINWDIIDQWMNAAPAVSVGTAMAVGGFIAWSSHVWGADLRQWSSRFGDTADHPIIAGVVLFIATVLAGIAFTVVAASRLAVVGASRGGPVLEQHSGGINPMQSVWISVAVNVGIWLLGIMISYVSHDPDKECVELYGRKWWWTRVYRWKDRRWSKRKRKVEAQIAALRRAAINAANVADNRHPEEAAYLRQAIAREAEVYHHISPSLDRWVSRYRSGLASALSADVKIRCDAEEIPLESFHASAVGLSGDILYKIVKNVK